MNKKKGFTLIELLLVIVIIAILAVVVFVALDPAKRMKDSRDARRSTDVDTILSAVHSYIVDNKGALPAGLTTNMTDQVQVGTAGSAALTGNCTVAANAKADLTTPLAKYLKTMPTDPDGGTAAATGYAIQVDANNLITVTACKTEGTTVISASR